MAFAAMLPLLASLSNSASQEQQTLLGKLSPGAQGNANGPAIPNNSDGGGSVLKALSSLGQQPGQPQQGQPAPPGQPGQLPTALQVPGQQTMTAGTQPVNTMASAATSGNVDIGQLLMQLLGQGSGNGGR